MTNESTPEVGSGVLRCSYAANEIHHTSNRLTREYRLVADDFKPGSHLEAGDLVKRRICPSERLEGTSATSHSEPHQRRASVDHDTVGDLSSRTDGMSEYPAPTYPEPEWERAMPESVR
jgi:hypothetical protein